MSQTVKITASMSAHKTTTSQTAKSILTINGGSSSIKFALFDSNDSSKRHLSGQIERIAQSGTQLIARRGGDSEKTIRPITAANHREAAQALVAYLDEVVGRAAVAGIGHRVV